jgi:2-amino-4-hydroxy-6-hydroxymethyldihydropteridine diphosphokinase
MNGYLSLGSNLGDRIGNLKSALDLLRGNGVRITAVSSVYETRPVETEDAQGNYLNLAAAVVFDGSPHELLEVCRRVESELGRQRPYFHAPRTIDIDILMFEGMSVSSPELTVPHPRMEQRAFVVWPLSEIAPDIVLPSGRGIIEVKSRLPNDEIVRVRSLRDE